MCRIDGVMEMVVRMNGNDVRLNGLEERENMKRWNGYGKCIGKEDNVIDLI